MAMLQNLELLNGILNPCNTKRWGSVKDFDGNEIVYGKKDFRNPSIILKSKDIL